MLKALKNRKKELIIFAIVYLILDIFFVGAFFAGAVDAGKNANLYETITKSFTDFTKNLGNPFGILEKIFSSGENFSSFINVSFWILIAFILLVITYFVKNMGKHEYDGRENGSSDWAKNGEEFNKLEDGSEILNKKNGFILSRNHYIGTDLKKVKINKNILVVGRIWCW